MLNKWIAFIKAHETILLAGGIFYLILTLGGKYLDHAAQKAEVKLGATQQVVAQDATQNKDLAVQQAAQLARYAKLAQTTQAQIAGLQAAIAARDASAQSQSRADQALSPADLATRWQSLLQLAPSDVVPGPAAGFKVSQPAAQATVESLEVVPSLVKDVKDLNQENAGQKDQLAELQKVNDVFTKQVMGLQGQLVDADKACKAQVAGVKTQARRSKLHWFAAGFVVGLVAKRLALGAW